MDTPAPSPRDVQSITAISDPVVRNLRITQAYWDISTACRTKVTVGANWCTFATWASRQAGRTIRGEDLVEGLKRRAILPSRLLAVTEKLGRLLVRQGLFNPNTRLGRLANTIYSPVLGLEAASREIAEGNRKVFEEIGFEFARFFESRAGDSTSDQTALSEFCSALRIGPPPEGQDNLRRAFNNYYAAKFTADPVARAQLEYLANLEIGFHEQIRLQEQIESGMTEPVVAEADWGLRLLLALFPGSARWWSWLRKSLGSVLGFVLHPLRKLVVKLIRGVVTEQMMTLTVADRTLSLAAPIQLPPSSALAALTNTDLVDLMATLPATKGDPGNVSATDWSDLGQRMRFIAYLFRVYHERPEAYLTPFTETQTLAIRRGEVPAGEL
jgi:hypothetical protein